MMRYLTLMAVLCLHLCLSNCKKERSETNAAGAFLEIQLINQVNGQPLQLNAPLTNTFNETFTLSEYKYFISNVELTNPAKPFKVRNEYFLIDEQNPDSKTIRAAIKADAYDALVFMIGVDSAQQVKGAQTGALDPANGMFWNANMGFMAAKLEGSSDFSGAPGNTLRHHIGGFEGQYNALRYVVIPLPTTINVGQGQTLTLVLEANLLRWFDGIYPMSIANNPSILTPGKDAMQIADNYIEQFSLSSVDVK